MGTTIFSIQGETRRSDVGGVDQGIIRAGQMLHHNTDESGGERESEYELRAEQNDGAAQPRRGGIVARRSAVAEENKQLVLLLCENKCFNEGEATRLLCTKPEWIAIQFNRNFTERLKTAISVSKTLVFQETARQRLSRAKKWQLKKDPSANAYGTIYDGLVNMEDLIIKNQINPYHFAKHTQDHFYRRTSKKNNLFFFGPPSTGKTMIMESLVDMHFNYSRLTGLTPNSSFNFASLVHTNACFMDECKLTDNQFEQWKLLAAGSPMSTDIKYKDRHDIADCVLYTASNYPIAAYLGIMECQEAITTRTIQFNFMNPTEHFKMNAFIWEAFWDKYAIDIAPEDYWHQP